MLDAEAALEAALRARAQKPGATSSDVLNDDPEVAGPLGEWTKQSRARPAAAASALLSEILGQFGPGVVVEIQVEQAGAPSPRFRLRGIGTREGHPTAVFDHQEPGSFGYADVLCSEISGVRVLEPPPGQAEALG